MSILLAFIPLFLISLFAHPVLAAPDALAPTRTTFSVRDFNPVDIVPRALSRAPAVHLSNAQRLARGLGPNAPRFHSPRRALKPRQSSACQNRLGRIQVFIDSPAPLLGYLSRQANSFGEFSFTTDPQEALQISFCKEPSVSTFDILTSNGFTNFPTLAGVLGFASTDNNLAPGSYNYAYIAASTSIPPGSPAQTAPNSYSAAAGTPKGVETNIWFISGTNVLTPSWVNTDGSVVYPSLVYVAGSAAFALTGDKAAFDANFGTSFIVTFTVV